MEGYVKTEIKEKAAYVEFFHPAHNSMPGYLLQQIKEAVDDLSHNSDIKIIVLQSGGDRSFCAGASFTELASIKNLVEGKNFFMGFANVINSIRKSNKLVIGRIQGKAVGGGVGLAAACDYVLATRFASVRLSELAVGIGPFVIGPAVERKIGTSAFAQMSLTPQIWQSADWAQVKGLYHEILKDAVALDARLEEMIKELSLSHEEALLQLKKVFWQGTEHWDILLPERAAISGELILKPISQAIIHKYKQG